MTLQNYTQAAKQSARDHIHMNRRERLLREREVCEQSKNWTICEPPEYLRERWEKYIAGEIDTL